MPPCEKSVANVALIKSKKLNEKTRARKLRSSASPKQHQAQTHSVSFALQSIFKCSEEVGLPQPAKPRWGHAEAALHYSS